MPRTCQPQEACALSCLLAACPPRSRAHDNQLCASYIRIPNENSSIGRRPVWALRSDFISPRYTTYWDEPLLV
ncbi:DUF4113 domain-containing protein [Caballeronia sp. GAWG2-1]|uniref:DUF4113 domain-containing protein n=1 Tax=Caballeronia sp. GAWG2-1 TaxID=2921744 RepID=UPI0032EC35C6